MEGPRGHLGQAESQEAKAPALSWPWTGRRESAHLTLQVLPLLLPLALQGKAPGPHKLLRGGPAKAEGTSRDASQSPRFARCNVVWEGGASPPHTHTLPFSSYGWASNKLKSAQRLTD